LDLRLGTLLLARLERAGAIPGFLFNPALDPGRKIVELDFPRLSNAEKFHRGAIDEGNIN
jgi:hypothetical protein